MFLIRINYLGKIRRALNQTTYDSSYRLERIFFYSGLIVFLQRTLV